MLIVYRILWIVGLVALIVELALLANPRVRAPQSSKEWQIVQEGSFTMRAPKQFRSARVPNFMLTMYGSDSEFRILEAVFLTRGRRFGMEILVVAPRQMSLPPSFGQAQNPLIQHPNMAQLLRKAHASYIASLREDWEFVDFKETSNRSIRVQGVPALRSDYTCKIPHPIDFLSMPLRGFLITVPLSQTRIVHINAYAPPGSFKEYEKVYEQMIASIRIQQGGY